MTSVSEIEFISWGDIPDKYFSYENLQIWLLSLANNYGKKIERLTYKFCNDHEMLEMNRQFLSHDYLTDILTFPEDRNISNKIRADILISWERVQDNSKEYNISVKEELLRIMAHGLLHLIGFRDKSAEDILIMRNAESHAINMWKEIG